MYALADYAPEIATWLVNLAVEVAVAKLRIKQ
jgi:hypothetical protein